MLQMLFSPLKMPDQFSEEYRQDWQPNGQERNIFEVLTKKRHT